MAAAQFIAELQTTRPELASALGELAELHSRRLWHELTLKLEEVVAAPAFCAPGDDLLVRLFTHFVADFAERMNQLKLSHIAVAVSARLGEPSAAVAFLTGAVAKMADQPRVEAPLLYMRTHVALLHLQSGDLAAAKTGVDEGRAALDKLSDADSSVHAAVYFVAAQLAKAKQDFAEFYKTGMLYLAYVSAEALPDATKLVRPAVCSNPNQRCTCCHAALTHASRTLAGAGGGSVPGSAAGREHLQLRRAAEPPGACRPERQRLRVAGRAAGRLQRRRPGRLRRAVRQARGAAERAAGAGGCGAVSAREDHYHRAH
jgi:hypothetical protein